MTPKLICLIGYKGAGKSTTADAACKFLNAAGHRIVRIGLADPIIAALRAIGVPSSVLDDKKRWNTPLKMLGGKTVRQAAVTLGTEWGREMIDVDLWTRMSLERVRAYHADKTHVIIDNVRFPSEFKLLRAHKAEFVAFERTRLKVDTSHESEAHILKLQHQCRHKVVNHCSFEEITARLVKELTHIIDKEPIVHQAWTTDEETALLAMIDDGYSYQDAADALGRKRSHISGKIARLKKAQQTA